MTEARPARLDLIGLSASGFPSPGGGAQAGAPAARPGRPRAHEYVADQLRRQIALRVIGPGRSLPAERRLADIFGVARPTVQRAIAILVAEGLVEKRRGRTGGTFVRDTEPGGQALAAVLARIAANRQLISEALAYRLALEPEVVAAACRNRTAADLERIGTAARLLAASVTEAEMMAHDTRFHLAVADAAHNRFFRASSEQIRLALDDALRAIPGSDLWMDRTGREHAAIERAIRSGDEAAGRRAALNHIRQTDRSVRAVLTSL